VKRRLLALLALGLISAAPPEAPPVAGGYEAGVAARLSGDNRGAARLLQDVVAREPNNSDAHLQLGLALLAAGELDAAEASFRRTLEIAPGYDDARIGLARIRQQRGDRQGALLSLEPVSPTNGDAAGLRTQLAAAPADATYRGQINVDASYSDLQGDQPDWREATVQLRYQLTEDTAVSGGVEAGRRFGRTDVYAEARVDQRVSPGTSFYLSAGVTSNADFRPEWQVGAGGSARVRGGRNPTAVTLDARQARYRAGDIQTVAPGVEQYLANGRAWLTARWINIFDETGEHHGGWLGRGDLMATERLRLFAGAADAPDVSEGVVLETFSLFGGLSYDVGPRSTVRLSVAHEDRERGSERLQVGLGLGWRF
jgi:YaiO family outer membrane protein